MRPARILTTLFALALAGVASCGYAPSIDDGVILCGVGDTCPSGYMCAEDGTCSKHPRGLADYLGTWTFKTGQYVATCSDDPSHPSTTTLVGSTIEVKQSGHHVLADLFCADGWPLQVDVSGTTAAVLAQQSCRYSTQFISSANQTITTNYDLSATAFNFSTHDGSSATTSGKLGGPFTDSTNASGRCDLTFNGMLTK